MENTKRNVYLKMKTLEEARREVFACFRTLPAMGAESVESPDAVDRVLAKPVYAKLSSPIFHAAAMDGIAVSAEKTFGASETRPVELVVGTDCHFLNTGHVMPQDCNAVIMIENIREIGKDRIRIESPAFPWQNVRRVGEDIVATELLFPVNHVVTPYCVGALLSGGVFSVEVRKRPRVLIIPTGNELVDWRTMAPEDLQPGQVIDSNSYVLAKLLAACGADAIKHDHVIDDPDEIRKFVGDAVANDDIDMVFIIGGSSAGSEDYARMVIHELGEVLVHGVTIMPGKPVVVGNVKGKPVFGMPGYPVSTIVAFEQFARPLVLQLLGQPETHREKLEVTPTRNIPSKLGVEEFLRVKLGRVGDRVVATPLPRGAGNITSITEAHGIIRIPNQMEGYNEKQPVEAELLCPKEAIENTVVVVGSHDNTLDVLADEVRIRHPEITLSSSHVGSMGGLMAIKRGGCHMAGTHLLDTEDGSYNVSYIKRLMPDMPVKLVHLVMRDQGLIVPKGNPKGIAGIEDLAKGLRFINRQGGSGTRILLDYRLGELGMDPAAIDGYENEEFTHMAVAVAVLSGAADVGLGINAAAVALNLDFIPVVTEQYDLVIPKVYFETEKIQVLLETIRDDAFQKRVDALGGYSTERTGTVTDIG